MTVPETLTPTKQKLLDSAVQLMLAKGFPATTLDEICTAAGVTKGSFFHYFSDKEEIGAAVLDHFVAGRMQAVQGAAFHKLSDPLKRVYGYIDFMVKMSRDSSAMPSCLLGNFAQDLSDTHPRLLAQCGRHFNQWAQMMKRDLDQAKAQYAPKAAFDTLSLADHCITVLEGALILAKARDDRKVIERQLRHLKSYLQNLFENDR
ncbi:MAG: TetR/AcrR family transcriptional regulator [Sulfuricaulis sp.]|uniref:TetR/AcrR family transcriptional regulator n=1 Tax=Sulfuricaulis sp. TaxID=2003553 RepID=UPI0025E3E329|nr:TetR/AcrR family transcriptional regulator [Sulfuricaulis sp.]MCR4346081.1 TetR/AcrR family transcriptional regulator [Sulfuricaulis sp.]